MLIETMLTVGKLVATRIITALEPVFGYRCDIYFPLQDTPQSIYQDDDVTKHTYNSEPDLQKKLIILNLLNENFYPSDVSFDNFVDDQPYILLTETSELPIGTKLYVYKGERFSKFTVYDNKVFNATDGYIYIKSYITPLS